MKKSCLALLSAALLALTACAGAPGAEDSPSPTPEGVETPSPAPAGPVSLPALPAEDYECCRIDEMGATLLMPKSWAGEYELDTSSWEQWGGISVEVKDYPGGEPGDPSAGNVVAFRLIALPTEEFESRHLEGETTQGWRDGLAQGRDVPRLWHWLGERDGVTYAIWETTDFSSSVSDEEKYAVFTAMSEGIAAYPADASAYFIFD